MKELEYPFDAGLIIKKKKALKRKLLEKNRSFIEKRIAVLGGSTTRDIVLILELFLLDQGIRAVFYESEYNKYWEDVMFDNPELKAFDPDIIYIHTSNRNIKNYPVLSQTEEEVKELLDAEYNSYTALWGKIEEEYRCPVIQNNFELPSFRLLGNADAADIHGRVSYINRLNALFAGYAGAHKDFYIQDINYLSACCGLDRWSDPAFWHLYKYSLSMEAIPSLAFNLSNIIKSVFGRNKKALALDLDNTLWGGIIAEDGADKLELSPETATGEVYSEFQRYIKLQKDIGVILTVCSKNDPENALEGLNLRDSILRPEDFIAIRANWEPKSDNLKEIAEELSLLPEAFVFVDDNPAERELVASQTGASAPDIGNPEDYLRVLDRSGFFEVTALSRDDANRTRMYKDNLERQRFQQRFTDYGEYLSSLEMKAAIGDFIPEYLDRIAQLTNKSNQFNLTTRRYTGAEIKEVSDSSEYICLYGRLEDKFGDNGVVSVVIGKKYEEVLNIDLWIMSCRVLKRDMEYAMMDVLVKKARENGIRVIMGYYYPTPKNGMVKDFYAGMGFEPVSEDEEHNTVWRFEVSDGYINKNRYITTV